MAKVSKTGSGGPTPISGSDSTESIQDTSKTTEAEPSTTSSQLTPEKQIAPDKYAAGDLKAAGNQIKSQLDSRLESAKPEVKKDSGLSPEQLAALAAKGQVRFAPPYVPVGPVVMGDNISVPGQTSAGGESTEMRLRADQFQINDQGNLVITNEKLIEYFKSLKETGQDILLGITNRKPPDEE